MKKAIQQFYPDEFNYCYGCGQLNDHGLKIESFEKDGEAVAFFTPKDYHISVPGFVYGGLIASLIDCHCIATASASVSNIPESKKAFRFVTASLHVDYILPTPLGVTLELRAKPIEIKGRKVVVEVELKAEGKLCATGRVTAVQITDERFSTKNNAAG